MDFPTRNLYRGAIEELARGSASPELEVTDLALKASQVAAAGTIDAAEAERVGDPGYHLVAEGRRALERRIGFRPPARLRISRFNIRLGIGGYVGAILLTATALLALAIWSLASPGPGFTWLALFALVGFLPATEAATALVNRAITWSFGAITLPGLELAAGVPPTLRTLVAVPTLLTSEADLLVQIERLEVHHLASASGAVHYALVSDGPDAATETTASDAELIAAAEAAIAALNAAYPSEDGARFLLLHRRRRYSQTMRCWMGWERKRGKLHELNRLLRGATDTSFLPIGGRPPEVPAGVRYVITLDADTRLHRDTVRRLIGKMAHPLNRPRFDSGGACVVGGHAILQPRVTPALPLGHEGSTFQKITSGPSGIDPYAAAVSDVYQDLFGEGSFTGKGIYDVDAFEAALQGRVAPDTQLSHDLFEGIFARSGFASDVEVIESFPTRYDVSA
jgi:cyclic beta-1,2-glucan synthetase